MASKNDGIDIGVRMIWGFVLLALFIFIAPSLFSYEWQDISLLKEPPNNPANNFIGPVGAWLAYFLFSVFGIAAYLVPLWCLMLGVILVIPYAERVNQRLIWCTVLLLGLGASIELNKELWMPLAEKHNFDPHVSGMLGWAIVDCLFVRWLSPIGAGILIWSAILLALLLVVGPENAARFSRAAVDLYRGLRDRASEARDAGADKEQLIAREEREIERERKKLEKAMLKQERKEAKEAKTERRKVRPEKKVKAPVEKPVRKREPAPRKETVMAAGDDQGIPYQLPPMDLLEQPTVKATVSKADSIEAGRIMIETLAEFGIEAEITNIEPGPVVTRFELLPAPGVRVEKIATLSNNLALALKASTLRVQAPIPGKGAIGIEVPNSEANLVYLREVIECEQWQSNKKKLPLALGKDVGGRDMVSDLAEMPHLLIAGATGAGKTVCMNSVLAGLLMSRTPAELRLILVDPKIVEFAVYNDLPHLVVPVITDPKKVSLGLRWAINEMEKRYKMFAKTGVRNIDGFNTRLDKKQGDMFRTAPGNAEEIPAKIPYIVIVIDELADLMLVDQAEIENCIARLAQLSRAVGIHMILSTQRPSVNVITGTIKANFPARIAFQVAQKVDSRTILDRGGAEALLGRGDMLFLPPGSSKIARAQGAMCTDQEINDIVGFIKKQAGPNYDMQMAEKLEKAKLGSMEGTEDDTMLTQAVEIIRETGRASTSSLQRRLRVGYTRAARMMDILEERGIVGPPRGSDPREILVDLDVGIPDNDATEEPAQEMADVSDDLEGEETANNADDEFFEDAPDGSEDDDPDKVS
jgi:S-DNA-T family DNA segregation ATPase FtsK/SpoIIIE